MNEISFHMENVSIPDLSPEFLRLWIEYVVKEQGKEIGNLSYIFCLDDYLLNINKQYLNHDFFTDIVTFDYSEDRTVSGDIFISIDTVRANAIEYSEGDFDVELHRVIIHGVLHLCGYNDKSDADQEIMTRKENWALKELSRFT